MTGQTDILFVYGSLMREQNGGEMMARLHQEARFLGPATCSGKLYMIDWYPGFVPGSEGLVHGEVYALSDDSDFWPGLDSYEGIGPDFPKPQEYERVLCDVTLNGSRVKAWAYAYRWSVEGKPEIPGGRFVKP